jgi:hypothetical protein
MHGHCYSDVPFPEDMRTSILKWAKGLKASDWEFIFNRDFPQLLCVLCSNVYFYGMLGSI